MCGLILAALYVAFSMVYHNTTMETATMWSMSFLWYWHLVMLCILGLIAAAIFIVGGTATICGKAKVRAVGAVGAFLITPLIVIFGSISGMLFLGGVYCVESSIAVCSETGEALPFAQWNTQMFIMGCVLYGIGALKQMASKISTSSSKSS